jgi:hypothetical protein
MHRPRKERKLNYSVVYPTHPLHYNELSRQSSGPFKYSNNELRRYKEQAIAAEKKIKQRKSAVLTIENAYKRFSNIRRRDY